MRRVKGRTIMAMALMRRAAAVKQWLVAEGNIPADRIKTAGYGETRPIASNSEGSGRSRNRRVVVDVR